MTLTPARIEAAARAIADLDLDDMTNSQIVETVLAAAYPDLVSGEAWIAPREATEGMESSMENVEEGRFGIGFFCDVWGAARDAYLAEQSDKDSP